MVMSSSTRSMRTGLSVSEIRLAMIDHLRLSQGRLPKYATTHDWYKALAYVVRDRVLDRCLATVDLLSDTYTTAKLVAYLSAEYLIGPQLGNNLINLGIWDEAEEAVAGLGRQLHNLLDEEEEPGLGNGGLGRLAACYMDSLSSLQVPAVGYGIRYEFGIFDQAIVDGWQSERTDKWLQFGNPWEVVRSDVICQVPFGGHTERYRDGEGRDRIRWRPAQVVKGIAHDTVVAGYRVPTTNLLRLWKAEAIESFDFNAFNAGDYFGAVEQKIASETISKVLYPNDEPAIGKRLRLALAAVAFLAALVVAAFGAEVNLRTLFTYFGNFISYFDRILTLEDGTRVWSNPAEWFWGWRKWLWMLAETILISYVGTMIGAVLAFALNFFAAQNTSPAPWLRFVIRRLLEFARTVPGIVFALIFVIAFGLGPMAGVLAIAIHSTGALGKLFSEIVENADMKPVEGVRSTGASWLSCMRFAVLPQVTAGYASYALLRFEINVREASVMGFVGAGGIGQELVVAIRKFYYSDVSAILVTIIVTVFIIDIGTGWLRGRLFGKDVRA